jgi:hypothetical protein
MSILTISGFAMVPDKYGRTRFLIEDDPHTITNIINYLKDVADGNYIKFPYEINGGTMEATITLKTRQKFWASKIEENRGKKINITVKNRKWNMGGRCGVALDLINLEN